MHESQFHRPQPEKGQAPISNFANEWLMDVRERNPLHAPAVEAQFELSRLIHGAIKDYEIFRVKSDPRHTQRYKLDCVAMPPKTDSEIPELRQSVLIVSVDANVAAWQEIVKILESLSSSGVTSRDPIDFEANEQHFLPQAKKFQFNGYPIIYSNTYFV